MNKFAHLLSSLYFTFSQLDKRALIEHYFTEVSDPDRGYALAVMANTLDFPHFKRSLIKELVEERVDAFLFSLSYDYVGDFAETVALLWPQNESPQELPSLSEIIVALQTLSKSEIKTYITQLLNQSNPIERWALLKLGLGSLRIGISERFLKNTLAHYGQVHVQEIEQIWHGLQPPYINLFAWLEKQADKPALDDVIFFHPVMLSHPLEEKEISSVTPNQFYFERKYDGIRVQIVATPHNKALFSRTGDNLSHSFPDVLNVIDSNVVLDGELVIIKEGTVRSFNDLQQRLNRKTLSKQMLSDFPAGIILYDILSLERVDLRDRPFYERRILLEKWFANHARPNLLLSDLLPLNPQQTLHELKQQVLDENHPAVEGLMIKHKDSPYLAGRPKGHWYKWKRNPLIVDAVLMYAQRGHGKRSSYYSDYTFGLWDKDKLTPIGKAYFGFTDQELLELDKWIRNHTIQRFGPVREVTKELVFEVSFDAVNFSSRHKSGVALRFPRINRIRWDKPAEEGDHLETLIQLIKP
ncbi:cisplatin damage response ATP-dependent DNA ligase [Legionella saoudiensis]|uniref:cisplatin damage response ATP-dependent DNA ligase n=1 Tax=Legionella saoudiensis TaxID=1750561 RepID=UPI0007307D6E|nr:cisplatin damage response ATP-dependent DNA ligase [Legionella saoudiensis]